jgi:hypothetical protein
VLAVDRVVRRRLERLQEVLEVGDLRGVDRLDVLAVDEPLEASPDADDVVAAAGHQRDHLVELPAYERRLAAGLLLEQLDPGRSP